MSTFHTFADVLFRKDFRVALFVALLTLTSAGTASSTVQECAPAEMLEPGTDLRGWAGEREDARTFSLEVPAAGIVSVDVMSAEGQDDPAMIRLANRECGEGGQRPEATLLERSPTRLVFATRGAGRWWFRTAARDPEGRLGFYRIVTGFTPARLREETFEATSGSGAFLKRTDFYAAANPLVLEQEGGRLLASVLDLRPGGIATKAEQEIVDPDPDAARTDAMTGQVLFYEPVCTSVRHDDHGDVRGCATPLALGASLAGELANDWHDDVDVFVLSVAEIVTVEIGTTGDADTFVALHDGSGHRLAADDDGGAGLRSSVRATLVPGSYDVRVTGTGGSEGAYEITVAAR